MIEETYKQMENRHRREAAFQNFFNGFIAGALAVAIFAGILEKL